MKKSKQLTFLPDPKPEPDPAAAGSQATEPPDPEPAALVPAGDGGIPIDPDQVITSLDDAIEKLGRELGRLGTILNQITDLALVGNFSQLYAQNITRYADLLLKQKALTDHPHDLVLELLEPALDRLNEEIELEV